jgi:tRNA pseudouridine38-40 synthase
MPRFFLTIEYDGTDYVGWQRQDNGPSIQGEIEAALSKLGEMDTLVYGAGRTDAGVHAFAQIAHVDLQRDWNTIKLRDALNSMLRPHPIAIMATHQVDDETHARFTATHRHYLYRIINRRPYLTVDQNKAWHVKKQLDESLMHQAAQMLIGTHDFTTYRASRCQSNSPVKTLDALTVERHGIIVEIRASARSFLHNQVRSLVGALRKVGDGSWQPQDVVTALEARSRNACAPVAPPDGLYLTKVDYPRSLNL